MFTLARALLYAVIFVGLLLIYAPAQMLVQAGIAQPANPGVAQWLGVALATAGGLLTLWCVVSFALMGKGTPAPFDAPRRLVVSGPYRFVRNPMYIGGGSILVGAAIFYQSWLLLIYTGVFFLAAHWFILFYEEPHLQQIYGEDYARFRAQVQRWLPRFN